MKKKLVKGLNNELTNEPMVSFRDFFGRWMVRGSFLLIAVMVVLGIMYAVGGFIYWLCNILGWWSIPVIIGLVLFLLVGISTFVEWMEDKAEKKGKR